MAASNGTIKRLVSDKGFGFILADDGNEYFFHNSACQGTRFDQLREGQAVTFEKGQGPKGPRAESGVPPSLLVCLFAAPAAAQYPRPPAHDQRRAPAEHRLRPFRRFAFARGGLSCTTVSAFRTASA